jgi:hypothetical protein
MKKLDIPEAREKAQEDAGKRDTEKGEAPLFESLRHRALP